MLNWLEKWSDLHPEKPVLYAQGKCWSYGELAREVERTAAKLQKLGVGPGSRVALLGRNSVDWVTAACAVFWRGAVLVPLPWRATEAEIDDRIRRAKPDLVVTEDAIFDRRDAICVEALKEDVKTSMTCPASPVEPGELMTILFTSGTTGRPKMVGLTAGNHLASAEASARRLARDDDDLWLCCLPMYHTGGLAILLRTLIYGTAFELVHSFDADHLLKLLRTQPITVASFVPTMVHRLLRQLEGCDEVLNSSLRAVLVGGGPTSAQEIRRARRRGLPVVPTYGMTEAASQIATLSPKTPSKYLDTVGRPLEGMELRLESPADDAPAMIWVRGPMVTDGYLDGPASEDAVASTPDEAEPRFQDGWFSTGDFGTIDDEGRLQIHHRRSERIVSGGENVDPREVEALLREVDGVAQAAVVGVDDPEWGEVVAAAVTREGEVGEGHTDTALIEGLKERCRRHLAGFKVPRRWVVVDELPTTATGKIRRVEIRNQWTTPSPGGGGAISKATRSEDVST